MNTGRELLIVIPVHNEAASLGAVLAETRLAAPGAAILVVDDASSDESAAIARAAGAAVVSHPFNLGYGAAIQTGFRYAAAHRYRRLVQLDGDGQHPPREIPRLLAELGRADLVIGSRFLGRGSYPVGPVRRLGMRLFSAAASLATGRRVTDASSGFQALNERLLRFLASQPYPSDFPDADTLIWLHRAGFRAVEVPVEMLPRRSGRSMIGSGRSVYYVFKMLLSILVTLLRPAGRDAAGQGEVAR